MVVGIQKLVFMLYKNYLIELQVHFDANPSKQWLNLSRLKLSEQWLYVYITFYLFTHLQSISCFAIFQNGCSQDLLFLSVPPPLQKECVSLPIAKKKSFSLSNFQMSNYREREKERKKKIVLWKWQQRKDDILEHMRK